MKLVKPTSLAGTLDNLNEAFFFERPLSRSQREEAAKWIAARQGMPGSYAGMPAPTEGDIKKGITAFTGEKVRSGAATRHILGEEASRALILLEVSHPNVRAALERASQGMMARLRSVGLRPSQIPGTYCCGICTCSLWRHLAAGGLRGAEGWLACGMKTLKAHRIGDGRWRRFPFFYTLLALWEIGLPAAVEEMRYAVPTCERFLRRCGRGGKIMERRRVLAERVLGKV